MTEPERAHLGAGLGAGAQLDRGAFGESGVAGVGQLVAHVRRLEPGGDVGVAGRGRLGELAAGSGSAAASPIRA